MNLCDRKSGAHQILTKIYRFGGHFARRIPGTQPREAYLANRRYDDAPTRTGLAFCVNKIPEAALTKLSNTSSTQNENIMATNGATQQFPPVELDFTLADVLKEGKPDSEELETVCMLKPNSDHQYGTAVPLSDKYIIHSAQIDDGDDLAHLQLENCCHLLLFFNGPTNVLFVACEGETNDESLYKDGIHQNAVKSFGIIREDQRPNVV